jgi:hypothetical protein
MDIQIMPIGTMLNKFFIIFLFLISCSPSKKNEFSPLTEKSYANIIEVENPILATILLNKYILHSNKLPDGAKKKHNAAIHTALMNPKNGVYYYWQHKKTKGIDKNFYGTIKIVSSTKDKRGICRTWLEEIVKNKSFINVASSTACLSNDKKKYILADEFFYDQF